MRRRICIAVLAMLLNSCAHESTVPVAVNDKFASQIVVQGPSRHADPILGISKTWYLKSFIDRKTGYVTHQLYVSVGYVGSWKFFVTAVNDQGQSLPVRQIDPNNTSSCYLQLCDAFGVELSDAVLHSTADTGFEVKIADDTGDAFILTVSPEMVKQQLEAEVQQALASRPRG